MNQRGGSRTDTLVKLVLIFFISLLSFSVGTFIGKTFTEKQYKDMTYEPTNDESLETASTDEVEVKDDSVDDEALSLTDEFAKVKKKEEEKERSVASENEGHTKNHEATAPKHDTGAKAEPAPKDDHKMDHKVDHKSAAKPVAETHKSAKTEDVAMRVAKGQTPTEAAKAVTPKPENLPKEVGSTTTGKYTIQIASYAKEDEANKHSADLVGKGFSAFVIPAQIKGQTWYRVSVGQFPTQSEAMGYKEEFVKKSNVSKVIIQKIAP